VRKELKFWCKFWGVSVPKTYRIPKKKMVTNEYNRDYKFCGYCASDDTIYYEGKLSEEAIFHEILHKRFGEAPESVVHGLTIAFRGWLY